MIMIASGMNEKAFALSAAIFFAVTNTFLSSLTL